MRWAIAAFACALWIPLAPANANSIDKFRNFVGQTQSARARFEQTVLNKSARKIEQASGTMEFSRPGKFRWIYDKPYAQFIVGDGARLWVYDQELNQVTVKKLDQAIGTSPAALLAGSNEIEKIFNLTNLGSQDGLEWLEAIPKDKEGNFQRIRMGFGANSLEKMELSDSFGQVTVIRFLEVERNPKLAPNTFRFVPPAGADVIGD